MDALLSGTKLRVRQLRAMVYKNWLFSIRAWKTTLLQLLAPLLFVLILVAMDALPKTGDFNPYNPFAQVLDQKVESFGKVPKCKPFTYDYCYTISYALDTPDDAEAMANLRQVMQFVKEDNGLEDSDLLELNSTLQIEENAVLYPNRTLLGLAFWHLSGDLYSYTIYFNASYDNFNFIDIRRKPDSRNELQISVDKALISLRVGRPVELAVSSKQFPSLGYQDGGLEASAQYGTTFFYCGIMFQFVILLYNICMEKDLALRRGLRMIGLKDSVYWLSWILCATVICILASLVLIASGSAAQFQYFTNTDFSVNFVLFLIYSLSIVTLAMWISVFIEKAKSSLNMGMGIFVLGLLFVAIVGNAYTIQAIYDDDLVPRAVPISFSFVPPFNLAKAMADINMAYATSDTEGNPKNATRYTWDMLFAEQCIPKTVDGQYYCKPMPSTYESLMLMIFNCLIFLFLTWYLDAVLPSSNGEPRPLYFFLQPTYWGIEFEKSNKDESSQVVNGGGAAPSASINTMYGSGSINADTSDIRTASAPPAGSDNTEDVDVANERELTKTKSSHYPLLVQNLTRKFHKYSLRSMLQLRPAATNIAVNDLCLVCEDSQVLSLLGHNGAGKTTAINMLTGMLSTTEGDSYIYGLSVKNDMDKVRDIMGICPQHDILWNDLTAREHMQIFCDLRQIPYEQVDDVIRERLEDVQLFDVQNNAVGTFSGGMKRRLSVALSFVGNPKIVYLDEPTTGMDPYIRRDIWNLILRLKKNRVIVMTTHSMEEADVLGDKIAVMALGKLRCVGSPVHLKNRFAGYKMHLVVNVAKLGEAKGLVTKHLTEAQLVRENQVDQVVYVNYSLSPIVTGRLAAFFELIESRKDVIVDFSISQTTLEEVFVNVTQESEYMASLQSH